METIKVQSIPRLEMAWEFLRRNPSYTKWFSRHVIAVQQLLHEIFRDLPDERNEELWRRVEQLPRLCGETVFPLLTSCGLPLSAHDGKKLFMLLKEGCAHAQQEFWLYAPANPHSNYAEWRTGPGDFLTTTPHAPQAVAYHLDPFLENPTKIVCTVNLGAPNLLTENEVMHHVNVQQEARGIRRKLNWRGKAAKLVCRKGATIDLEIELYAPDDQIWPAVLKILAAERRRCKIREGKGWRDFPVKREKRTIRSLRELLRIYDEVQARLEKHQPQFPGSGSSNPVLREARVKYKDAKALVDGGYKRLIFGRSVAT